MTPEEIRLQAEVDRLKAALRSIADQCDGILRRRWNDWELTARVQQMGARAAEMIDAPDRSDW